MQFHQLRYVLEVANEKSISAAAKKLYLSQPSLSQQILNFPQSGIICCKIQFKSIDFGNNLTVGNPFSC